MPKQIDHDDQRRLLADAAINAIDTHGLENVRLRDVATSARVTTGAVTHYFDSKNALLEAALGRVLERLLERQAPSSEPRSLVDVACEFLPADAQSRMEWRVWLAYVGRAAVDPALRAMHRRYYDAIIARLAGASGLGGRAARQWADAVVAAVDGLGLRITLEPDDWPPKRRRETLALLLHPLDRLEGEL
jgi:TetR/AcrR family transcriptional repressor of bet genes